MLSEVRVDQGQAYVVAYWEMVAREIGQFNSRVREGVTNEYGTRTQAKERSQAAGRRRVGGDCR